MLLIAALFMGTLNFIGGESIGVRLPQGNRTLTIPDGSGLNKPVRLARDVENLVPPCATMPCETLYEQKYLSIPVVVSLKAPVTMSWAPKLQFKDINNQIRASVDLTRGTNDEITLRSLSGSKSSASIPRGIYQAGDWLHLWLTYDSHKQELNIKLQMTGDLKLLLALNLRYANDLLVVVKNIGKYGCSHLNVKMPTLTTKSHSTTRRSALLPYNLLSTTETFATSIMSASENQPRRVESYVLLQLVVLAGLVISEVVFSVMLLIFVLHIQKYIY